MAKISFIGTRELTRCNPEAVKLFRLAAAVAGKNGHVVKTGAAPGADQLAAETALRNGGKVEIFLPWESYERPWMEHIRSLYGEDMVYVEVYDPDHERTPHHEAWAESVNLYHPAAGKLTQGSFKLHARNFGIVVDSSTSDDPEGYETSDFVVALPSPDGGGTAQGMRVASDYDVRIFDLSTLVGREDLSVRMTLRTRESESVPA